MGHNYKKLGNHQPCQAYHALSKGGSLLQGWHLVVEEKLPSGAIGWQEGAALY